MHKKLDEIDERIPFLYNLYFLLVNGKTFKKNLKIFKSRYPENLKFNERKLLQENLRKEIFDLALSNFSFPRNNLYLPDGKQNIENPITKDFYRRNHHLFKSKSIWKKSIETSGSTGIPLKIIRSPESFVNSQVSFYNFFKQFSLSRFDKNVYIGGARSSKKKKILQKIKDYIIFKTTNQKKYVSADLVSEKDILSFIKYYEFFKPIYLHGFSSALLRIANFIKDNDISLEWQPFLVHPIAEGISKPQRDLLKEIFNAPVAMVYGATECHMASECSFGRMHVNMENCDLQQTGEGSSILTVFGTDNMPIVNYKIGDLIKISDSQNVCECGRDTLILEEIVGREQDIIELKNGFKLSHPDLNMLISQLDQKNEIIEYQIVHDIDLDSVELRTVNSENFDSNYFISLLSERFVGIVFKHSNEPFILLDNGKKPVIARIGLNPETRKTFFSYNPYKEISESQDHQSSDDKLVLKLDWNESTFDFPDDLKNRALEELSRINLNFYPDLSNKRLKKGLSEWLDIPSEKISVFNGSDSGIATICRLFVESQDKVITINPTYGNYKAIASRYTQEVVEYHLEYPFKLDFSEFRKFINLHKPKLVFITNPNNPTGVELNPLDLVGLSREYSSVCFVVDEAYAEFGTSQINLKVLPNNMIVLRTFSKAFGLAGIRLGYAISEKQLSEKIALSRDNKEVDVFAQIVGSLAIENPDYMLEYVREVKLCKTIVTDYFKTKDIEHISGSGNFILFKVKDPFKLEEVLKLKGIFIRNRTEVKNLEGFLRVTIGDKKTTRNFLSALDDALSKIKEK